MRKIFLLLTFFLLTMTLAAQVTVTGVVTDADTKEPLPGVNVIEKGTARGTVTDIDGKYSFEVSAKGAVLSFSFMGYQPTEVTINEETVVNIALASELVKLDEVLVVGYGIQKKSVVTGSIAKVNGDELAKSKDTRIEQSLQGRTAGVVIMNNSGQPGDNLTIRIRGTGTNKDPDPLFIIDGLPMDKEGLNYLNSSDVESVEVLKDAASSAIYGARGANGVVIITTKQGKKGEKFSVSYDGYYGIQNPWHKMDMLNSQQYMEIINEANTNDGSSKQKFPQAMMDTITWSTNWQDEMYNYNAPKTSHTFTFTGGSNTSTYSSSISYYSQDGIVAKGKSGFDRLTYRLNTTHEFGKLLLGSNINLVNIKIKGIDGNSQYGTGINQALNMPPIVPVTYSNGTYAVPNDFGIGLQEITNPIALLSVFNEKKENNKALGNIYGVFTILKGLKLRSDFGMEYSIEDWKKYTPVFFIDPTHYNDSVSNMEQTYHKYVTWNWENTLVYDFSIGKNNITAMLGMTRYKKWDEDIYSYKQNLIFNDLDHAYFDNAQSTQAKTTGGYNHHTLASYFGRLNYNYDEKYLFEGVFRADGSSRFGSDNKYGYFPSVSVGWVASRESFFPKSDILNFTKLRLSWGQNGSENIDDFAYTSTLNSNLIVYFGDDSKASYGILPAKYPNSALKWETSEQLDIGLDLAFLSNRVSLTMDYYNKKTKDWLIEAPTMLEIGNSKPTVNGGNVQNTGFELELGYKNRFANGINLNTSLNLSTNKNKVLSLNNEGGQLTGGEGVKGQDDVIRAAEGLPLGYFWGYQTAGIIQNDADKEKYKYYLKSAKVGDLIFVDANGDSSLDKDDRVNIGNPYPKVIIGWNFGLDWKGIDFYMFWYAALGQQVWNANRRDDLKFSNFTTEVLNRWHGEGTSTDYPRVTLSDPNGTWKKPSDFYVEDADYLRLKTITLGYSLPVKAIQWLKLEKVRLYVTSENLLTFTKYKGMEMEVGGDPLNVGIDHGTYPMSRTFLGGLNINF
jgi:TonB-dependent starch-binding outer membrane protein SusC